MGGNIAAKWKGKYRGMSSKEAWFILTNLKGLDEAIALYQKRMGIEEMFRDFKKRCDPAPSYGARERAPREGGYDLERTKLTPASPNISNFTHNFSLFKCNFSR